MSGGRFGRVDGAAGFSVLQEAASGSCADLRRSIAAFAVNVYAKRLGQPARIAIFGVAAPAVASVALTSSGDRQVVPLERQSFLVVRAGNVLDGLVLEFTTADGATAAYPLAGR